MTLRKFDLAVVVALVPLLGTGLLLVNQLGRFFYYGVPAELLELDAYRVLTSSLSMLVVATAMLYVASTMYDSSDTHPLTRLIFHVSFAAVLTMPFWMGDLSWERPFSWPTLAFVLFMGVVFFSAERWLRREVLAEPMERIAGWALLSFFGLLLMLTATLAHGYLAERDRTSYTFIGSSDDALIARFGDLLILKTYDRERQAFIRERTQLLEVEGSIVLEARTIAPVGERGTR